MSEARSGFIYYRVVLFSDCTKRTHIKSIELTLCFLALRRINAKGYCFAYVAHTIMKIVARINTVF